MEKSNKFTWIQTYKELVEYLKNMKDRQKELIRLLEEILGEKCYKSLLDIKEEVDIVDVFRKSEAVLDIAKEAVQIKAKTLWMQEGVINLEAKEFLQKLGVNVVMDKCILKVHKAQL